MRARTVHLGKIGRNLEGPAIGKLIAVFLNNCAEEKYIAVVDCDKVQKIGPAVLRAAKRYLKKRPISVIINANEQVKNFFIELLCE